MRAVRAWPWALAAALVLDGGAAAAQEAEPRRGGRRAPPVAAMQPIDPQAFLDAVEGRTMEIVDLPQGTFHGREEFLDRTTTRYARADGSCLFGDVRAEGLSVCFSYEEIESETCWYMFRDGGRLLARTTALTAPSIQEIVGLTEEPVICEGAPSV